MMFPVGQGSDIYTQKVEYNISDTSVEVDFGCIHLQFPVEVLCYRAMTAVIPIKYVKKGRLETVAFGGFYPTSILVIL